MKRMRYFLVVGLCVLLLTGCTDGKAREVSNKLPKDGVEELVKQEIKKSYGDEIVINYTKIENLYDTEFIFPSLENFYLVKNANTYYFYVSPKKYPELNIKVSYKDGYTEVGESTLNVDASLDTHSYKELVSKYENYLNCKEYASKFGNVRLFSGNYYEYILVVASNLEKNELKEMLHFFENTSYKKDIFFVLSETQLDYEKVGSYFYLEESPNGVNVFSNIKNDWEFDLLKECGYSFVERYSRLEANKDVSKEEFLSYLCTFASDEKYHDKTNTSSSFYKENPELLRFCKTIGYEEYANKVIVVDFGNNENVMECFGMK